MLLRSQGCRLWGYSLWHGLLSSCRSLLCFDSCASNGPPPTKKNSESFLCILESQHKVIVCTIICNAETVSVITDIIDMSPRTCTQSNACPSGTENRLFLCLICHFAVRLGCTPFEPTWFTTGWILAYDWRSLSFYIGRTIVSTAYARNWMTEVQSRDSAMSCIILWIEVDGNEAWLGSHSVTGSCTTRHKQGITFELKLLTPIDLQSPSSTSFCTVQADI